MSSIKQQEGMAVLAVLESDKPRVRVAAVILLNEHLVLVRHRKGEQVYHLLPGGGVSYGETLQEALLREVLEETGLVVQIGRPILINDTISPSGDRHLVNITFAATVTCGAITDCPQDDRIEAVDLVDPSIIGDLDMRPPISVEVSSYLADQTGFPTKYVGSVFTTGE